MAERPTLARLGRGRGATPRDDGAAAHSWQREPARDGRGSAQGLEKRERSVAVRVLKFGIPAQDEDGGKGGGEAVLVGMLQFAGEPW